MKKITMDDFKENKLLILITFILTIFVSWTIFLEPTYYKEGEAAIIAIIVMPIVLLLFSFWMQAFWNRILRKIVDVREISYGVAFLLLMALLILLG